MYCVDTLIPHGMCGGQRTTCKTQFSPPTIWIPETELSLAGFEAHAFMD